MRDPNGPLLFAASLVMGRIAVRNGCRYDRFIVERRLRWNPVSSEPAYHSFRILNDRKGRCDVQNNTQKRQEEAETQLRRSRRIRRNLIKSDEIRREVRDVNGRVKQQPNCLQSQKQNRKLSERHSFPKPLLSGGYAWVRIRCSQIRFRWRKQICVAGHALCSLVWIFNTAFRALLHNDLAVQQFVADSGGIAKKNGPAS
jgi:hypothetical protein